MHRLGRISGRWLLTGVVVALLGTANVVSGDGGDTGLIHACVNSNDGTVRIVDAVDICKRNETAAHWPTAARFAVLDAAVSALQGRVAAVESKDAAQDATASALQAQVAALQAQDAGQGAALATLQGQVAALQSQVAALQSKDAAQDAMTSALQSQVAALQSADNTVVFGGYKYGPVTVPGGAASTVVAQLSLPAGSYMVIATAFAHIEVHGGFCHLERSEPGSAYVGQDIPAENNVTFGLQSFVQWGLTMSGTTVIAAPGRIVSMICWGAGTPYELQNINISAIKVGQATETSIP